MEVANVGISTVTGLNNEFTVNFINGKRLVLISKKYLEIVKMFNYAQLKIEDEYGTNDPNKTVCSSEAYIRESKEIICHLALVILVGLFNEDNDVKNISYNLLVVTQNAFNLNFGSRFQHAPEVYVPDNTTTFLSTIAKALAESSPELTRYMWSYFLEGLENDVIPHEHIPTIICCLSYWVPNLYKYVYLVDEEEGANDLSKIIRSLIKLTVKEPDFTTVYLQQIWFLLVLDDRLSAIIVEEFITHALDRDSENRDWKKAVSLLTAFPTVEVACQVIGKLMDIINSFLPSLKMEVFVHSWSELEILVKISVSLFFESPLLTQMCLPEVLFIISLLIDIGPTHIRYCLHELLMNICHSLMINSSLPKENSEKLDQICTLFSRQKLNFMSGFSQEKGRILPTFSASSFSSKFGTLDHFVTNVFKLMEYGSISESAQWKTKYKKYLMGCIFNHESFLSARAMMILGIIGKEDTTEILCRDLLAETMKIFAEPVVTDEQLFVGISHIFTYSKIVAGLDPAGEMLSRMFWLSTVFVESSHPILFEGGLQFMINCLNYLYEYHFKNGANNTLLAEHLMEKRKFASFLLDELEGHSDCLWTKDNFDHLILGFITRGLSLAVLRGVALECLVTICKYSYREHTVISKAKHYLNYLFFLFLVSSQDSFLSLLEEFGIDDEFVELDDNNKAPKSLIDWISSDNECANITLYQGAMLFASTASDEPSKLRFELLTRYLLNVNPDAVFRYYFVTRQELRRISTLEQQSDCSSVAFEIVGMLVMYDEFDELDKYNDRSVQLLKSRGLLSLTKINVFGRTFEDIMTSLQDNSALIYHRKRLTTLIISKIIHDSQLMV
ncbi:Inhibitory regulator protein IRA2 [Nakaseomyces bracarensis]|uniref:Inhibitory regulator protein IRA2 n=1 Tax=Nakaseomyces bracarensis TaxID=273131 RepID=UPI0038725512